MKLYLICTLAAVALALNAEAAPKDKPDKPQKDKPPVMIIPIPKAKTRTMVRFIPFPDAGSTALLLGTAILALGVARRRFATR